MKYAYIENDVVVETNRELPINWKNISNFNLLDNETIKNFGWYEYKFLPADVPPEHKIVGRFYEIKDGVVIESETIAPITEQDKLEEINSLWQNIRSKRNFYLEQCDWTQVLDSPFTEEQKELWRTYRQALRDITLQTDVFNIVWPIKPGTENE